MRSRFFSDFNIIEIVPAPYIEDLPISQIQFSNQGSFGPGIFKDSLSIIFSHITKILWIDHDVQPKIKFPS